MRGRAGLRGRAHARRLRRRSTRRAARRLAGATYAEIAAAGRRHPVDRAGDAQPRRSTSSSTRRAPRLDEMLRAGTTTAEAKSGYGLTLESELTMLRAIRRLDHGAADRPRRRRSWARTRSRPNTGIVARTTSRLVINEMIPAVAREGLAEWCDVFCERGVFTPEESRAILEAGRHAGLKPRIHANELGPPADAGGGRLARESADHLVFVDDEGIAGPGGRRRRGDVAAGRRVLPQARPLRAGAAADRRRRAGRARDGRESRRRLLAIACRSR